MRGEDVRAVYYGESTSGTSPRAWRKQGYSAVADEADRETSAYAEKLLFWVCSLMPYRNISAYAEKTCQLV